MKRPYPLKLYLRDPWSSVPLLLALFVNAGIWVWLLSNIRFREESIFLHYNVLFGVDRIGPWWQVLSYPFLGLCLILGNGVLGWVLYERDWLLPYVLNITSLLLHIFLGIGAYLVVNLNV